MAISSHLDESMHVFKNGTTARLMVTPWNRSTVADGFWQNTNTIRPLSARDVYLAECIDELSAKQIVYGAGPGISIFKDDSFTAYNRYYIAYDSSTYKETKYTFGDGITSTSATIGDENVVTVGINYDNSTIKCGNNGLYSNLDGVAEKILTATYKNETYHYEYTYHKGTDVTFSASLNFPTNPQANTIYLVG